MLLGDFNGHNVLWGSNDNNHRGELIEDFITKKRHLFPRAGPGVELEAVEARQGQSAAMPCPEVSFFLLTFPVSNDTLPCSIFLHCITLYPIPQKAVV